MRARLSVGFAEEEGLDRGEGLLVNRQPVDLPEHVPHFDRTAERGRGALHEAGDGVRPVGFRV